jgi:molybdopterin molybdotransferase
VGMSWAEARALAYDCAEPLPPVDVAVADCSGLVLARDVVARVPVPAFDVSAMDGWAVRGAGPWRVTGSLLAGDVAATPLGEGEACAVATGAAVPGGTEAVLPLELGAVADGLLEGACDPGRHVRRTGEEVAQGTLLLASGTVVTPAGAGLAAAVGHDALLVHPRPVVAAVVTGSELLATGLPGGGRVRDAVGPLLAGAVPGLGGLLRSTTLVPDDRELLLRALAVPADVVLTSGSSSVGPADHLSGVLAELGADVLVDGVDVRPGHPQLLARLPSGSWVVGLPGNPLAALVALVTLAGPLLARLAGLPAPVLSTGVLAGDPGAGSSLRLVPVSRDRSSPPRLVPTGHGGSAMLRGAAVADALAVVPAGCTTGDLVELVPLPG